MCYSPLITATGQRSPNVFVNSEGIVRLTDLVAPHPFGGCGPDVSPLTLGAETVFVNSLNAGRMEDIYTPDNIIISGSENVFIGRTTGAMGPQGPQGPPGPPGQSSGAGTFGTLDVDSRELGVVPIPLAADLPVSGRGGSIPIILDPVIL